ncbi:nitrogenase component 1 [Dialister sp.]|uniref:nitrogenase component 1 n=1 Tax=Dialister sp. TaxID=1955814 RepID=UPI003F08AF44
MNTDLTPWLPCQAACELMGSTCFFLSIKDSAVLINGPRWCASIAASEMASIDKKYEKRIFCSELQEKDLLYGTGENLLAALEELKGEMTPSFLGILTSCSASLIGDDLNGICLSAGMKCPLAVLDSGGLRGEFYTGYRRALEKFIDTLSFPRMTRNPRTVNIIGWCSAYPNHRGDLTEIKRILSLAGIRIGICLGAEDTRLDDLAHFRKASLNIVLCPELGEAAARQLKEKYGMNFLLSHMPCGLDGTLAWVRSVARALQIEPDMAALEKEAAEEKEQVDAALSRLKINNRDLSSVIIFANLTEGTARGLLPALMDEYPDTGCLYLRMEGTPRKEKAEKEKSLIQSRPDRDNVFLWKEGMPLSLPEEGPILVLGNTFTRGEIGHYQRAVYVNLLSPAINLSVPSKCYAGLRGWLFFLSDIFREIYTLAYMNRTKPESQ